VVRAKATGGAFAFGDDQGAHTCDTTKGGTAKVISPTGGCSSP
jgi:hypothetical protein